jgi:hypothetical protein
MTEKLPAPPQGAGTSGKRLWKAVHAEYLFEEHEMALLREAVRVVDQLDAFAALVERDGLLIEGPAGVRVHPAAVESRQARIALARILAALQLPAGEDVQDGQRRPQRRVGVRGAYPPASGRVRRRDGVSSRALDSLERLLCSGGVIWHRHFGADPAVDEITCVRWLAHGLPVMQLHAERGGPLPWPALLFGDPAGWVSAPGDRWLGVLDALEQCDANRCGGVVDGYRAALMDALAADGRST